MQVGDTAPFATAKSDFDLLWDAVSNFQEDVLRRLGAGQEAHESELLLCEIAETICELDGLKNCERYCQKPLAQAVAGLEAKLAGVSYTEP